MCLESTSIACEHGRMRSAPSPSLPSRILRLRSVVDLVGLSRSTIYKRVSEGKFPKPLSLGGHAVGWRESEVQEWLATLKPKH